jgi:hypothetical protein
MTDPNERDNTEEDYDDDEDTSEEDGKTWTPDVEN